MLLLNQFLFLLSFSKVHCDFERCVSISNPNIIVIDPDNKLYNAANLQTFEYSIVHPKGYLFVKNAEKTSIVIVCDIPVGNCPDVGVTGFALGGGYGMSARSQGLLVDNIVEMEVVTVDGVIRRGNELENRDLFWALRGAGGGNFGVVTKFKFKTFDASHEYIWIDGIYPRSMVSKIFKQWHNYLTSSVSTVVTSELIATSEEIVLLWIAIDSKKRNERKTELQKILNFFPFLTMNDVQRGTYIRFYHQISLKSVTFQIYVKTISFYVKHRLNESEMKRFQMFAANNPNIAFWTEMYGGVINKISKTQNAFMHRDVFFNLGVEVDVMKSPTEFIFKVLNSGHQLENDMIDAIKEIRFMDSGETYQNYVNDADKHWSSRYYGENYKRLQEIKNIYDPKYFFRFNQSIAPASNS